MFSNFPWFAVTGAWQLCTFRSICQSAQLAVRCAILKSRMRNLQISNLNLTLTYRSPNSNPNPGPNPNPNPDRDLKGVQTLRTQDTSDPGHFGTSAEVS